MRDAYKRDCQFEYGDNGYFSISLEAKMIEEGAVVMQSDLQFYGDYAMKVRKRWGYDPFRISKNVARLYHKHSGLPVQKDTILKEVFDPQVLAMRSGGLLNHFLPRLWLEEDVDCTKELVKSNIA